MLYRFNYDVNLSHKNINIIKGVPKMEVSASFIRKSLKEGKKVINQISKTEFRNRAILYVTIVALFLADLILAGWMIAK